MSAIISIGSDMLVTLTALTNEATGAAVNNATVSGELYDSARTNQLASWNMPYVSATAGNYQGTLPAATTGTLTQGTEYKIKVTATASGVTRILWDSTTANYT